MANVTVRPYQEKDRQAVEQICVETAGSRFVETPRKRRAAAAAFCRYFITRSPEFCFVAADESDRAVGYILCTPSFGRWCRYAPEQFFTGFPFSLLWSIGSMLGALPYIRHYPAHLHINLLSPYRRLGLGSALMDALENTLKQQGICGVSLCVSSRNSGAIRFYEARGFRVLGRHPGSIAYGKKLAEPQNGLLFRRKRECCNS